MFTGIISAVAKVAEAALSRGGLTVTLKKPKGWRLKPGESVSVSGVCSTVARLTAAGMTFEYIPETLARSNLGGARKGTAVNLERSLRASDRLDGHVVQGHVDAVGKIRSVAEDGNSRVLSVSLRPSDRKHIGLVAKKGSVALEGVSLTVTAVSKTGFTVKVIPYTLGHTNLGSKRVSDTLNVEFDVLAKYVQSALKKTNRAR